MADSQARQQVIKPTPEMTDIFYPASGCIILDLHSDTQVYRTCLSIRDSSMIHGFSIPRIIDPQDIHIYKISIYTKYPYIQDIHDSWMMMDDTPRYRAGSLKKRHEKNRNSWIIRLM